MRHIIAHLLGLDKDIIEMQRRINELEVDNASKAERISTMSSELARNKEEIEYYKKWHEPTLSRLYRAKRAECEYRRKLHSLQGKLGALTKELNKQREKE